MLGRDFHHLRTLADPTLPEQMLRDMNERAGVHNLDTCERCATAHALREQRKAMDAMTREMLDRANDDQYRQFLAESHKSEAQRQDREYKRTAQHDPTASHCDCFDCKAVRNYQRRLRALRVLALATPRRELGRLLAALRTEQKAHKENAGAQQSAVLATIYELAADIVWERMKGAQHADPTSRKPQQLDWTPNGTYIGRIGNVYSDDDSPAEMTADKR